MTINLAELSSIDRRRRADEFSQVALALMASPNSPHEAAKAMKLAAPVVEVLKAQVSGMDLSSTLAYPQMSAAFVGTLTNASAFDAVLQDAHQVRLNSRFGVVISDVTGALVSAFSPKPLGEIVVNATPLEPQKVTAQVVASDEMLRHGVAAAQLIGQSLRASIAKATDAAFTARLLSATTPIPGTGSNADDVLVDLRALLAAVTTGADSRLHLIMGSTVAKQVSVLGSTIGAPAFIGMGPTGGTLLNIPVHVSDALTTEVILLDARALAMASEEIRLRTSGEAAIQMADVPTNTPAGGSPVTSTESNMVSMFQTNSVAILIERTFGFAVVRSSGIASLSGTTWGSGGSP